MKYPDFLKAIKGAKVGDKAIFSGEYGDKEWKDKECVLGKTPSGEWYIAQDYLHGNSLPNKYGKLFTWIVNNNLNAKPITSIRLVKKQKPTKPQWKEGDFFDGWEKLTPFLEDKTSKELGLKVGQLIVLVDTIGKNVGKIYKVNFVREDNTNSNIDVNGIAWACDSSCFAPLPNYTTPSVKSQKPTLITLQEKQVKYSDSETIYTKEGIEFGGKKYTAEEATELAKKIRREVARFKKLKF